MSHLQSTIGEDVNLHLRSLQTSTMTRHQLQRGLQSAPFVPWKRSKSGNYVRGQLPRSSLSVRANAEPNWEEEMLQLKKRTNSPNQLETLRKIEAEVEVGKVLYTGKGIAIVDGLNNDAPLGTKLSFVSGASGVLLWRRSDNICYVLLLGGNPGKGEGVVCQVKAILQIVDESDGPSTKRDYEIVTVPAGGSLVGQCTDFLGRPEGSASQAGLEHRLPLFNQQVPVEDREQIAESLLTGVKAVDVLTPVGRGQAQLITGPPGSGKTSLVLDAILGQESTGVRCVYAAVGQSSQDIEERLALLRGKGAMSYTSVVAAPSTASLGMRYAALCAACSRGEQVRDAGGHALVVLDDISCMVEMWEHITAMLAELGSAAVDVEDESVGEQPDDPEKLVEYEGMLVSVAAAQRRRFFAMLVQRAAKMHRRKGGGSLSLLLVLTGRPATGKLQRRPDVSKYQHLTPELKAKLEAALQRSGGSHSNAAPSGARTEVVEEFMSMVDGQTVVVRESAAQSPAAATAEISETEKMVDARETPGGFGRANGAPPSSSDTAAQQAEQWAEAVEEQQVVRVDATASVSRIGGRAYPSALQELALTARLDLVQALDAHRFSSNKSDPATLLALQRAERLVTALAQLPGHPVPLEEQVAILFAVQSSLLSDVASRHIPLWLSIYVQFLWKTHPQMMRSIAVSQALREGDESLLQSALEEAFSHFGSL